MGTFMDQLSEKSTRRVQCTTGTKISGVEVPSSCWSLIKSTISRRVCRSQYTTSDSLGSILTSTITGGSKPLWSQQWAVSSTLHQRNSTKNLAKLNESFSRERTGTQAKNEKKRQDFTQYEMNYIRECIVYVMHILS